MILLTNDDGYNSPGLRALAARLRCVSECLVVTPRYEQSGVSYSLNVNRPLRAEQAIVAGVPAVVVDGSPVDCVKLAIFELMSEPPELVVSGINIGVNLGSDIFYSGTVGGALEAALNGLPSMAVSTVPDTGRSQLDSAAEVAVQLISSMNNLFRERSGQPLVLNVNVPVVDVKIDPPIAVSPAGPSRFKGMYEKRLDPRKGEYYWLGAAEAEPRCIPEGCDIDLFRRGFVTITPLLFNMTDSSLLDTLRNALPARFSALDGE